MQRTNATEIQFVNAFKTPHCVIANATRFTIDVATHVANLNTQRKEKTDSPITGSANLRDQPSVFGHSEFWDAKVTKSPMLHSTWRLTSSGSLTFFFCILHKILGEMKYVMFLKTTKSELTLTDVTELDCSQDYSQSPIFPSDHSLSPLFFSSPFPHRYNPRSPPRPPPPPTAPIKPITNWLPVMVSARSRRSHGKIEDCERSIPE